jgi:DNA-binding transcriptional ArsR family regulator
LEGSGTARQQTTADKKSRQSASARDAGEPAALSAATHDFLKALASPTRQRIMLLFARGAELSVNEVTEQARRRPADRFPATRPMRRGGIVTSRRDGKTAMYRAGRDGSAAALADL